MLFDNIVGNDAVKDELYDTLVNNKVANSYMFIGEEGIGKLSFAKVFAKAIMCLKANYQNGCECDSCIKFDASSNPDYMEIHEDKNLIRIDQIRNLADDIARKHIVSNKKVYVISDARYMTEEAQNCLLKTLEEPPKYANIILVTSNENSLLPTVQSRCIKIRFSKLSDDDLKKIRPELTNQELDILDGSLKGIENIEEKLDEYQKLEAIVNNLQNDSLINVLNNSDILYNGKDNINDLLNYLNIILFKNQVYEPIPIVEETKKKIQNYNNYEMCIDYLLMNAYKIIQR